MKESKMEDKIMQKENIISKEKGVIIQKENKNVLKKGEIVMKKEEHVMEEKNDILIEQFFAVQKASMKPLPDYGFTRRVMLQLPDRTPIVAQLWSIGCTAAALALFFYCHGAELLWNALREVYQSGALQSIPQSADTQSWLVAGVVILFLICQRIVRIA